MALDRSRDLELQGRGHHTAYRRIGLALLCLIVLGALLGVFGQSSTTTVAASRQAMLSIEAPARLRGGLLFQARFEIVARRSLEHPRLLLSPGWLEAMTLNTVAPSPIAEGSSAKGFSMSFEPLSAGERLTVWTDWQVNPTNVGEHDENVALLDGDAPIASAHRSLFVFP